jgi:hypothetical protein
MTARYTMDQISAFLYDALNEESLSAHQIYETIIETVAEHTEYLQIQYEKSQQLFDLLKGTAKPDAESEEEPEDYDYEMPPEKEDKVIKWSLPVEEAEDGEYYITFPEDLLEAAKLAPGDNVEWVDLTENTYLLRKVDE